MYTPQQNQKQRNGHMLSNDLKGDLKLNNNGLENYSIIDETKKRAQFFQTVHAWPLSEVLDYQGWLSNFKTDEEKQIACHILDFFTHYPKQMTDRLLRNVIGQAGRYFNQFLADWEHDYFRNRCLYSYIPGERPNPTDSGHRYVTKIRDLLNVPQERIIDYDQIPTVLDKMTLPTPVVFVDDFIGTGNQCIKAWKQNIFPYNSRTLEQLALDGKHPFAYAPLIGNELGYNRITSMCTGLHLVVSYILGPEYNLFNQDCICWKENLDLYDRAVDFILNTSKALGIPDDDSEVSTKGFGGQGLALAIETTPPDAVPAFFFWCQDNWKPLIKRSYKR